MKFDLNVYINQFKKKKKFQIESISEIDNILNSEEYFNFIDNVYKFCNSHSKLAEGRLNLQYYWDADKIINQFWELLIGKEMSKRFKSMLEEKLKI